MLVFMGGFGVWAQVRSKGLCVGKEDIKGLLRVIYKNFILYMDGFAKFTLYIDIASKLVYKLIYKTQKLHKMKIIKITHLHILIKIKN